MGEYTGTSVGMRSFMPTFKLVLGSDCKGHMTIRLSLGPCWEQPLALNADPSKNTQNLPKPCLEL